MSRRWYLAHKRDPFYRRAKREGYRSRAAYKLLEIQKRFNLLRPGARVVDLGASPGGWSQVAKEIVGLGETVVAIDRAYIAPLPGLLRVRGDFRDPEIRRKVRTALGAQRADCIVSDMSPDLSGNYGVDEAKSEELSESALDAAARLLRPGGRMVVKVFEGQGFPRFLGLVRRQFRMVSGFRPRATRARSSETYVVARGFRPPARSSDPSEE